MLRSLSAAIGAVLALLSVFPALSTALPAAFGYR